MKTGIVSIIVMSMFILLSCTKEEPEPDIKHPQEPQAEKTESDTWDITILDSDNWLFGFNKKATYSFNCVFGSGELSWTRYGVTYTGEASLIHDNVSDVYTISAYEAKRDDYLLYVMDWDDPASSGSFGGYNFINPNGYYYKISADLTNGVVGGHSVLKHIQLDDLGTKDNTNKSTEVDPNDYAYIIVDDDNWNIYLNRKSYITQGIHFYKGKMSWTRYGIEYTGDASAIYIEDKDVLGIICWEDKRKDALQYNLRFTNADGADMSGYYIFTKPNSYHYKIGAALTKGQIGTHLPVKNNTKALQDHSNTNTDKNF